MIADRIHHLRKRSNMSQQHLAQTLNISSSTVGMYEQGRRIPGLDILIAMARVFDVSLDYLATGAEYSGSDAPPETRQPPTNCPCCICCRRQFRE